MNEDKDGLLRSTGEAGEVEAAPFNLQTPPVAGNSWNVLGYRHGLIFSIIAFVINEIYFNINFSAGLIIGLCWFFQALIMALDMFLKKYSDRACLFLFRASMFNLGVATTSLIFLIYKNH